MSFMPNHPAFTATLHGLPFKTNKYLTVPGPPSIVPRTWRERLFTRPWRPWVSVRSVSTTLPDPNVYIVAGKFYSAHPETAEAVLRKLHGVDT